MASYKIEDINRLYIPSFAMEYDIQKCEEEYNRWYDRSYKVKPRYIGNINLYTFLWEPFITAWIESRKND